MTAGSVVRRATRVNRKVKPQITLPMVTAARARAFRLAAEGAGRGWEAEETELMECHSFYVLAVSHYTEGAGGCKDKFI